MSELRPYIGTWPDKKGGLCMRIFDSVLELVGNTPLLEGTWPGSADFVET